MSDEQEPLKSRSRGRGPTSQPANLPAPVGGWNTRDSQARMDPKYALYMENLFPTAKTVDLRAGCTSHATNLPATGKHLMSWSGVTGTSKLFACTNSGIYDVTSAGAVGAASSVITNGRCYSVNFRGTGGSFLVVVNGTDDLRYYNGTTWTTVASFAISGGGTLLSNTIAFINSFKRALFFLKNDSMSFYYLPIDQITGTVAEFPLGAIFSRGGYLLSIGNWTFDGGAGIDDYTVFATSEGQLAVYKGTDPSSSTTWSLVGVYDLGLPMGRKCFAKYGGDLLYLSSIGVWSLQRGLNANQDRNAGTLSAIINEAFQAAAAAAGANKGWQCILSPTDNMLLVNIPFTEDSLSHQYVMNLNTRAWCKFTGWNATSWELLDDQLYMIVGNVVAKALRQGTDFGATITAYCKCAPQYLSPAAAIKHIELARFTIIASGRYALNVEFDVDFEDSSSYLAPSYEGAEPPYYDEDLWDTAVWAALPTPVLDWMTVAADEGYNVAPRLRLMAREATLQWSSIDYAYSVGQIQG